MKEEFEFMNPMSNQMGKCMKEILAKKVVSSLCNEDEIQSAKKKMFDDEEGGYFA